MIPRINTLQCDVYGEEGRRTYSVGKVGLEVVGEGRLIVAHLNLGNAAGGG